MSGETATNSDKFLEELKKITEYKPSWWLIIAFIISMLISLSALVSFFKLEPVSNWEIMAVVSAMTLAIVLLCECIVVMKMRMQHAYIVYSCYMMTKITDKIDFGLGDNMKIDFINNLNKKKFRELMMLEKAKIEALKEIAKANSLNNFTEE